MKKLVFGGAFLLIAIGLLGRPLAAPHVGAAPAAAAAAVATPSTAALSLIDRALDGPAGPDDEGQYKLIDPIGPGGATAATAQSEVFAPTMIGGQYSKWRPYHDPFFGGGYPGNYSPGGLP
ncbi:MAG TPA: hypothetical protein VGX02_05600 [Candidatus Eremiobacteraceae bacterium]|nr:hypothetical protein [Candidatus Eremiobacteraceae bacterium]